MESLLLGTIVLGMRGGGSRSLGLGSSIVCREMSNWVLGGMVGKTDPS
jgi:hypothetical protein